MGLKVSDGSNREVNVVAPSCQYRVGVNPGVFLSLKIAKKRLPHGVFEGFSTLVKAADERCADEVYSSSEVSPQVSRSASVVQNQRDVTRHCLRT